MAKNPEFSDMKQDSNSMMNKINSLATDSSENTRNIDANAKNIDANANNIDANAKNIDGLTTISAQNTKNIGALATISTGHTKNIDSLAQTMNTLANKHIALQAGQDRNTQDINDLQVQNATMQENQAETLQEVAALKTAFVTTLETTVEKAVEKFLEQRGYTGDIAASSIFASTSGRETPLRSSAPLDENLGPSNNNMLLVSPQTPVRATAVSDENDQQPCLTKTGKPCVNCTKSKWGRCKTHSEKCVECAEFVDKCNCDSKNTL